MCIPGPRRLNFEGPERPHNWGSLLSQIAVGNVLARVPDQVRGPGSRSMAYCLSLDDGTDHASA